jgi:hypothetical protein
MSANQLVRQMALKRVLSSVGSTTIGLEKCASRAGISRFADALLQNLLVSQQLVTQINFNRISGVRTSFHGENIRHIGVP